MSNKIERTKTLTSKTLLIYKLIGFLVIGIIIVAFLYHAIARSIEEEQIHFEYLMIPLTYSFLFFKMAFFIKKISYVEYDTTNLYVTHNDYQIQIPFEEIKDVQLTSIDGIYKFILYRKNQIGNEILCKPSIWYPLNYKKVDKELNRIRYLIKKQKESYHQSLNQGENNLQLSSINLDS